MTTVTDPANAGPWETNWGLRWPVAPLLARHESVGATARALGIDTSRVHKWRQHGLTTTAADRAAVTLGLHPGEVWGEWWQQ